MHFQTARLTRVAVASLSILLCMTAFPAAQQRDVSFSSGVSMGSGGGLIWSPTNVYRYNGGTTGKELMAPGSYSLARVRGIVHGYSSSSTALIWTKNRVHWYGGMGDHTTYVNGPYGSIPYVDGIVFNPDGKYALIWNMAQLYLFTGYPTAIELKYSASNVDAIKGVVFCSTDRALIWTKTRVFRYDHIPSPTLTELKYSNISIGGTTGIVVNPRGQQALMWTKARVFLYTGPGPDVVELKYGSASMVGVQGIVVHPSGQNAMIWTAGNVYVLPNFTATNVSELKHSGASIVGVRGIVTTSSPNQPFLDEALIWTRTRVYRHIPGTIDEVVDPDGFSFGKKDNVRGVVYFLWKGALLWTQGRVLRYSGSLRTQEVTRPGSSLYGVHGMVSNGGSYLYLWAPSDPAAPGMAAGLYKYTGGTTVTEVKHKGHPVYHVRGIAFHPTTNVAVILTPYLVLVDVPVPATELLINGTTPLSLYDPNDVPVEKVVMYSMKTSGASYVGKLPMDVSTVGSPSGASMFPEQPLVSYKIVSVSSSTPNNHSSMIFGDENSVVMGNAVQVFAYSAMGVGQPFGGDFTIATIDRWTPGKPVRMEGQGPPNVYGSVYVTFVPRRMFEILPGFRVFIDFTAIVLVVPAKPSLFKNWFADAIMIPPLPALVGISFAAQAAFYPLPMPPNIAATHGLWVTVTR